MDPGPFSLYEPSRQDEEEREAGPTGPDEAMMMLTWLLLENRYEEKRKEFRPKELTISIHREIHTDNTSQ